MNDILVHEGETMQNPGNNNARRGALMVVIMAAAALLLVAQASADEITELKEQVQTYTVQLAELEKADSDLQSAIKENKRTELWLTEAQAQLIKEEEDVAKRYLRRVSVSLGMIEAIIETAKVEKTAFDRESASIDMEKQAFDSKAELEKAEAKERQLMLDIEAGGAADKKDKKDNGGAQ